MYDPPALLFFPLPLLLPSLLPLPLCTLLRSNHDATSNMKWDLTIWSIRRIISYRPVFLSSPTPFIFLQRTRHTSTTSPRALRFPNPPKKCPMEPVRNTKRRRDEAANATACPRVLSAPKHSVQSLAPEHPKKPCREMEVRDAACLCSSGCGPERLKVVLHSSNFPQTHTHTDTH